MKNTITCEKLLDKMVNNNDISNEINYIKNQIDSLKLNTTKKKLNGRYKNYDINSLNYVLEKLQKDNKVYFKFKNELRDLRIEYQKNQLKYISIKMFYDLISNDLKPKVYNEMNRLDNIQIKISKKLSNLIEKNKSIEAFENDRHLITVEQFCKNNNFDIFAIYDYFKMESEDKIKKEGLLNKRELTNKVNKINDLTVNFEKTGNLNYIYIDNSLLTPSCSDVIKIDGKMVDYVNMRYQEITNEFNKMSQELKEKNVKNYNNEILLYKNFIMLHQDCIKLSGIKDLFKDNEVVNKFMPMIDKRITDNLDKITNIYKKIAKRNGLGKSKIEEDLQKSKMSKLNDVHIKNDNNEINKKIEQQKNDDPNKQLEIEIMDDYRSKIRNLTTAELKKVRNELYPEYYKMFLEPLETGKSQRKVTFVEFLKSYYPDQDKLIELEEIKEEQILFVVKQFKKSGASDLISYAKNEQGVVINYPYFYIDMKEYTPSMQNNSASYAIVRKRALEEARKRFDSKSSLWKVLHKKQNLHNINLDNLTVSEIDDLYKKGRGK